MNRTLTMALTINNTWFVYLLRCADSSLYAGITTDLNRRLHEHNHTNLGAKYTKARRPVTLAFVENSLDRSSASKQEYILRKLTKAKKEQKVATYLKQHTAK